MPQFDLRAQHAVLTNEIEAGMREVLASGRFVLGAQGDAFEREVAQYLGVEHAVGCNSGTDALHLALIALGVGPGDEVITTPFSFIATAEAICHVGARPVFVDIRPDSYNLDPDLVEAAISPSTRALLPAHLFGQPARTDELLALSRKHGLVLVEDCAQSFGARRGTRMSGTHGDAGCFSFFPTKNLGACGDAGMVATNSTGVAQKLRMLRNHGARERHDHPMLGYNSRLDEMQAVVLRAKLRRIDHYNTARRSIAHRYSAAFAGLAAVVIPHEEPATHHVFHQYTLLVPDRDGFVLQLQRRGIGCAVHYPRPLHAQMAMQGARRVGSLEHVHDVASRCVCLPMYPELSELQVERVIDSVRDALHAQTA